MKKGNAAMGTGVTGAICIAAGASAALDMLPLWGAGLLIVVAFPFFVVLLGLWWNASEGEGDIPFIGY
ncbi:MAG: hypothetical protein JXA08_07515 [Methanomicrobiaceae archaeon]|nr:hypothetical protein [Methanomicrobiaceae archaeon]